MYYYYYVLHSLVFSELSIIAVSNVTDWFQGWSSSDAVHFESELGSNSNDKLCVEVRQSFRGHIQRTHNSTLRVKRSLEAKPRPLFWATYPCQISRPDRWFACEKVPAGKPRSYYSKYYRPMSRASNDGESYGSINRSALFSFFD